MVNYSKWDDLDSGSEDDKLEIDIAQQMKHKLAVAPPAAPPKNPRAEVLCAAVRAVAVRSRNAARAPRDGASHAPSDRGDAAARARSVETTPHRGSDASPPTRPS